jgi:hypothetical protein
MTIYTTDDDYRPLLRHDHFLEVNLYFRKTGKNLYIELNEIRAGYLNVNRCRLLGSQFMGSFG